MRGQAKASSAGSTQGRALGVLIAVVATLGLLAAPANAAKVHLFKEVFGSVEQPSFLKDTGMVVDQSSGDLLVIDSEAGTLSRYNPDGTPSNFSALGANVIDGVGPGADETAHGALSFGGPDEVQVTVDNSGTATDGNIYVVEIGLDLVDVFAEDGEYLGQLSAAGATPFGEPCGVAVDPAGAVYVGDFPNGVHKFLPAANPPVNADHTATFTSVSKICTLAAGAGPSAGYLFPAEYIGAVSKIDSSTGALQYVVDPGGSNRTVSVDPTSGNLLAAKGAVVNEYDASGAGSATLASSITPPSSAGGVAVRGANGDVYISREGAANLDVYGPPVDAPKLKVNKAGTGSVTSSPAGIDCGSSCEANYAEGTEVTLTPTPSEDSAFTSWSGCDNVEGEECKVTMGATDREITATFTTYELEVEKAQSGSGTITSSPEGIDCGASCAANFKPGAEVTLTATADSGSKFKQWSGCDSVSDTQCEVTMGAERKVIATFAAPPTISEEEATAYDTSATLKAVLDPESEATKYSFQYVDQESFEEEGFFAAAKAPIPAGLLPATDEGLPVSVEIESLSPTTTYHFRLVAFNSVGTTLGAGGTFTTHSSPPVFESCPNDTLRGGPSGTGPGLRLPDCRAYEQASPVAKNGQDILGSYETVHASINGDAVSFATISGIPGGEGAQTRPVYLASRGESGWSTQGILPPAGTGEDAQVSGWTRDFAQVFGRASESGGDSASTLLARASADGSLTTIVPHKPVESFAFAGASKDGSKVFFEAKGAALAPGAAPGKNNLYAWDRETEAISLVGQVPLSPDTECGPAPACATPAAGSFAGSYAWATDQTKAGGAQATYYTQDQHAISSDGNRTYFTAGGTGQLYLREDPTGAGASTVHVSASQRTPPDPLGARPAAFMAATTDGSAAFFTSAEELTDDANTGPEASPPAIGRAPIDNGDPIDLDYLLAKASSVAVSGSHIYWSDPKGGEANQGTIGRAKIGTTEAEEIDLDFVDELDNPQGVAVNATHVYWTAPGNGAVDEGTIGRAKIGTTEAEEINESCITGLDNPLGIALNTTHVYWTAAVVSDVADVGRTNLDPDCAVMNAGKNESLIPALAADDKKLTGVALDATHVYFMDSANGNSRIGCTELSGANYEINCKDLFLGAVGGYGVAVDASNIYWTQTQTDSVGRAKLDGGEFDEKFIEDAGQPEGLAIDATHIYWVANQSVPSNPGNDLYRYDATNGDLTDISLPDDSVPDGINPNGAEVKGVLGTSEDGSHVYFVANGVLTSEENANKEVPTPGTCQPLVIKEQVGECNLYLLRDEEIVFIARLKSDGGPDFTDAVNWTPVPRAGFITDRFQKTARVSADGETLLFRSQRKLSDYESEGEPRLYRYDAEGESTLCVSCNPSGAPPVASAEGRYIQLKSEIQPATPASTLTRNLSEDGNRIFFESTEALVATDTNEGQDVYMWEAEGSGSCESDDQNGGCLYLLSSGDSPDHSFFADASASGDDAFIITRSQLVSQDQDQLYDAYDVSVEGGIASQNEAPPFPCEGEGCRDGAKDPPAPESAGSANFSGPPNPNGRKPKRGCPKGKRKVRVKGRSRCVPKKSKRRNRANKNRRASR